MGPWIPSSSTAKPAGACSASAVFIRHLPWQDAPLCTAAVRARRKVDWIPAVGRCQRLLRRAMNELLLARRRGGGYSLSAVIQRSREGRMPRLEWRPGDRCRPGSPNPACAKPAPRPPRPAPGDAWWRVRRECGAAAGRPGGAPGLSGRSGGRWRSAITRRGPNGRGRQSTIPKQRSALRAMGWPWLVAADDPLKFGGEPFGQGHHRIEEFRPVFWRPPRPVQDEVHVGPPIGMALAEMAARESEVRRPAAQAWHDEAECRAHGFAANLAHHGLWRLSPIRRLQRLQLALHLCGVVPVKSAGDLMDGRNFGRSGRMSSPATQRQRCLMKQPIPERVSLSTAHELLHADRECSSNGPAKA